MSKPACILSIDLADSSTFVANVDPKLRDQVFKIIYDCVKNQSKEYHGRIWSWEGDGGLILFDEPSQTHEELCEDSIRCAVVLDSDLSQQISNLLQGQMLHLSFG